MEKKCSQNNVTNQIGERWFPFSITNSKNICIKQSKKKTKPIGMYLSRLCMTDTIALWIQSNTVETFKCHFLLIGFLCHSSRRENQITNFSFNCGFFVADKQKKLRK